MRMARFVAACCGLLLTLGAMADTADTRQGIIDPSFKTLQVAVDGYPMAPPIISLLNPSDRILISFDQLAEDRAYLRAELIHCDKNWQPSGLVDSEFLDGFNLVDIDDYDFSRATTVHYVNYRLTIPSEQMRPTIPGNYLVRIYNQDDPETTLLQARFSVSDDSVGITGGVTTRTDIDTNLAHQQVELRVDPRQSPIDDIYNDLTVIVTQNGRPDNEVTVTHPLRAEGRIAVYEHLRPLIFDAGNEYRRMEIVSTTYPGMHVERIGYNYPLYNFALMTDTPRAGAGYLYDQTQHGRFVIREYNSTQSDVEADYGLVHFTLQMPRLADRDIYIDGDLTCRRLDPAWRMTYHDDSGAYELTALLKQGAYNYQYLVRPASGDGGATGPVEGNYADTVNEYTVKVYHRPRGTRYDRLVGYTTIFSHE